MSSTVSNYAMFNNKLKEFIEDLGCVLGHVAEYKMIKSSVSLLCQIQPTQNQIVFNQYVAPYAHFIRAKDETFFLDEQYQDVSGGVVTLLKGVWGTLCKSDQESIWDHMRILLILNERCLGEARTHS